MNVTLCLTHDCNLGCHYCYAGPKSRRSMSWEVAEKAIDLGFDEDAAWAMLKSAKSITIAKGKKFEKFSPAEDGRAAVMKKAMGPSGNLRAPTYRVGDEYVIGFNADLYNAWLKSL